MSDGLPPATTGDLEAFPRCPWCGGDPGEATFTLSQLVEAQSAGYVTGYIVRESDGQPPDGALIADCPGCCRPFIVRLQSKAGWRFVRLMPCRTPTDAKLARGGG